MVNDAGNQSTGPVTPGSSGTLSNSQCSVDASAAAVTASGNNLTVSIAPTFTDSFSGSRAIYMWAISNSGVAAGYQQMGTYTVPAAVTSLVSASSGSGNNGTLQFVFSHSRGYANLAAMEMVINSPFSGAYGCYLRYERSANRLYLVNDAGNQFTGPVTPGGVGSLSNSQCTVTAAAVTANGSGNNLTISVPVAFSNGFSGSRAIYLWAISNGGQAVGYQQMGTWTVAGATPPALVSATSGSGTSGTLQFVVSDSAGYTNLSAIEIILAGSVSASNSCYLRFEPGLNRLFLVNDAGNQFTGPATPGSGSILSNSQCSVGAAGVTAAGSGSTLTLSAPFTFTSAFAGKKTIFMWALSRSGLTNGYTAMGNWTTTASAPGVPSVVSTSSGSGASGTLQAVFSDTAGATDLAATEIIVNAGFSGAHACYLRYDRAANTMSLVNDAGNQFGTPAALGSATILSNAQCSVSLAVATAVAIDTTLTLSIPLTFVASFSGTKNIYLWALSQNGATSGYAGRGSWVIP